MRARPRISVADVAELSQGYNNEVNSIEELPNERDQVFLLKDHSGQQFDLKVANLKKKSQVLEFQNGALSTVEQKAPWLPSPRVVASIDQIKRGSIYNLDQVLKSFN